MNINLIPDSSVASAPADFSSIIEAAAEIFEQDIPGNYTVNITYGWGTYDNVADDELSPGSSALSIGGTESGTSTNYATLKNWLTENATSSDQKAAVASLPDSDASLPGDADSFYVSSAQEKALGVYFGSSSAVDGSIGFNTADTQDPTPLLEEAALTEMGHALGDLSGLSFSSTILDLYRYSAPGDYQWTGGQPAYFSVDGGATNLANFSTSFDVTLFYNLQDDAFSYPLSYDIPAASLTSLDLEVLNVMGFGGQPIGAPNDFLGNGLSDIVWQNASSGAVYEWLMTDDQPANSEYLGKLSGWRDIGSGNFHGDGVDGILWQNQSNGQVYEWSFADDNYEGQYVDSAPVGSVYLGNLSGWEAAGVGAFHGAGTSGIVWQNDASGIAYEWQIADGQHSGGDIYLGNLSGWSEVGTGDFNGDGTADMLWQSASTGAVYEWQMASGQRSASVYLGNLSNYTMVGAGDFNGDGITDLLWKSNTTGEVWEWQMNSAGQNGQSIDLGNLAGYNVASIGDFNGSGVDGIVWKGASAGDTWLWTMSNGQHTGNAYLGNLSGWTGH
jgi:FG-GAP-like repeat